MLFIFFKDRVEDGEGLIIVAKDGVEGGGGALEVMLNILRILLGLGFS